MDTFFSQKAKMLLSGDREVFVLGPCIPTKGRQVFVVFRDFAGGILWDIEVPVFVFELDQLLELLIPCFVH